MVAQQERVGAGASRSALPATRADESPPRLSLRMPSRHGWALLFVATVLVTMVCGLWRLSGDTGITRESSVESVAEIRADGSIGIVQRIDFATPRSRLTVSIPVRRAPVAQFGTRIDELRVRVDGRSGSGLTRPLRVGETRSFRFAEPATTVVLSYSVEGAVERTRPSAAGRALALVTPLSLEGVAGTRSRLEIDRDGVLNLGCVAPGGSVAACGSDAGRRWVVARSADDPVVDVVAQIDLPESERD